MRFSGKTVAAIIEFPNNEILLVKRATIPFKGYWALPGGKVDAAEKVETTVVREVKEETGLGVEIVRKIGEYHESGGQDGVEYDFFPTCFLVRPVGGRLMRQEREVQQLELFGVKEVPESLAFAHSTMIRDYVLQRPKQKLRG